MRKGSKIMKYTQVGQVIVGILLMVGLTACEAVDTPDGKIPSQYLNAAKALVGTYQGQFNHAASELSLKLDGDTPVLTYTDARGHDLLGPDCGSLIGKMTKLGISIDEKVGSAIFEFNPGKCTIEGRVVDLDFNQSSDGIAISISMISGHHSEWIPGDTDCSADSRGHIHCHHTPGHWITVNETIEGKFKKMN
jgi:hypothetical protein